MIHAPQVQFSEIGGPMQEFKCRIKEGQGYLPLPDYGTQQTGPRDWVGIRLMGNQGSQWEEGLIAGRRNGRRSSNCWFSQLTYLYGNYASVARRVHGEKISLIWICSQWLPERTRSNGAVWWIMQARNLPSKALTVMGESSCLTRNPAWGASGQATSELVETQGGLNLEAEYRDIWTGYLAPQ